MSELVSRQAVIDAMYKILHDYFWANDEELDAIIATLNDLPSAQPEQKGWVCPVCGRGLSPLTMVCPCNNGKGWEITCKT